MKRVDISGVLENGMWDYQPVYPAIRIEELPRPLWGDGEGEVRSQVMSFGGQSGSSIATGGHLFPDSPDISDISLDRLITDAVILEVEAVASGTIELDSVLQALDASGETVEPGDALLIATGWDRFWNQPEFLAQSPGLSNELAQWVVERSVSLLGSDIPLFDPQWRQGNVLPPIYSSGTLVFAPLVNLSGHGLARARLYALPIKVKGSCAAPCRAFLEFN